MHGQEAYNLLQGGWGDDQPALGDGTDILSNKVTGCVELHLIFCMEKATENSLDVFSKLQNFFLFWCLYLYYPWKKS